MLFRSILIGKNDLLKAKQIIKKKNEIIFPALKYSHTIQTPLKWSQNLNIKYNISHNLISRKTQSFSEYFHDAGQFYLGSNYAWKNFTDIKKRCFKIKNDKAIDVDNYDDFEILKAIYNFKK